ncbi:HNH endonuclease [Halosimplex carlsbadense]|uniref:HNH endonuclease n=1 Tax=Halosimplex carlsbadense TaxID=171164 RepID=UPI0009E560CC
MPLTKHDLSNTPEYYGAKWHRYRKKAWKRDFYQYQHCGMGQEEHREKHGRGLDVHHIQPVRAFDYESTAHILENLVTLCRACHANVEPDG